MASHHHHHHHYSHYNQPPSHCCCPCPPPPPPPPPPPSTAADPLLQIAAHIVQSHSPSHRPNKPLKPRKPAISSYKAQHQSLLHSLARRVAALELSLQNLSAPPSSTPRDAAARTIQTHFRALLARRSRTLSHLRLLASIKSNLAVLRACSPSSSSGRVDLARVEAISRKAGDMLVQLDSIESGDVMIREGKRSVGAELVQFWELIDGLAKRKTFSGKTVKKVTFANGGEESKIYAREPEIGSDEQSERSPDDQHVSENKECSIHDDDGSHVELESFHQDDEEENNHVAHLSGKGHWGRNGGVQEHTVGGSLFAPLPIKMEPRIVEPDLVKKKKVDRIVSP